MSKSKGRRLTAAAVMLVLLAGAIFGTRPTMNVARAAEQEAAASQAEVERPRDQGDKNAPAANDNTAKLDKLNKSQTKVEHTADAAKENAAKLAEFEAKLKKYQAQLDADAEAAKKSAAKLAELEAKLTKSQTQAEQSADAAKENAAKLEKLEAKLKKSQTQLEQNVTAARENAGRIERLDEKLDGLKERFGRLLDRKIADCENQINEVAQQLGLVQLRAAAARFDALLLDQQFSKVQTSCLEEQVRGAEGNLQAAESRFKAGTVTQIDPLQAKAGLCMFRGSLAWVKGDLPQCQKQLDDAVAACKEVAAIVRAQYQAGLVAYTAVIAAETASKEVEICADRAKARIAARAARPAK